MGDQLDLPAMLERFRERAQAVRDRPLPPIGGEERLRRRRGVQRVDRLEELPQLAALVQPVADHLFFEFPFFLFLFLFFFFR